MRARTTTSLVVLAAFVAGCSSEQSESPPSSVSSTTSAPSTPDAPAPDPTTPDPTTPAHSRTFPAPRAYDAVEHLAGRIGLRLATSRAFRTAADWSVRQLEEAGYVVRRQHFDVPAGDSWGVAVGAGRSQNVIAEPPGFDPTRPHLLVGAHLDSVAVSPGAEDNASGVGVLLALAETDLQARLPTVLVLFGAEEPLGPGDDEHHFGSRHYVAAMGAGQRRALRGMLALDRVGVGDVVPLGSATEERPVALVHAAERAGVPYVVTTGQRSSDHWSFVRAGLPGVRVGSTSYAAYHSANDLPEVVSVAQLRRVGRVALAWLRG